MLIFCISYYNFAADINLLLALLEDVIGFTIGHGSHF